MPDEPLFKINPTWEVESQVDAIFAPLYSLIPEQHHRAIIRVEQDTINAIKGALRQPSAEPVPPDPSTWPFSSGERLDRFLTAAQRKEVRESQERMRNGKRRE